MRRGKATNPTLVARLIQKFGGMLDETVGVVEVTPCLFTFGIEGSHE